MKVTKVISLNKREVTSELRFPHSSFFLFSSWIVWNRKSTSGRIIKEGFAIERKECLTHSCMEGLKSEKMEEQCCEEGSCSVAEATP